MTRLTLITKLREVDYKAAQLRLVLYDRYGYVYKPPQGGE